MHVTATGPFTVFAPTDAAFAKVPTATLQVSKNYDQTLFLTTCTKHAFLYTACDCVSLIPASYFLAYRTCKIVYLYSVIYMHIQARLTHSNHNTTINDVILKANYYFS